MSDFGQAVRLALGLIGHLDPEFLTILLLSLKVSLSAALVAFALGAPFGALLAIARFPGRDGIVVLVNALLGLPPVVVGLAAYLLLSRSGPLGALGLLFTPGAMIFAQTLIAVPIVAAFTHRACEPLWATYGDMLLTDGASKPRALATLLAMAPAQLATAFLGGFGRAIAEVGAIMIVGGNIRGATRTMTTAIALETSRGDLPLALALGLCLIALTLAVSILGIALSRTARAGS